MTLQAHPRRKRDLLAPFKHAAEFQQLTVEDFAMSEVSDAAWDQYARDRDKEALTTKRTLFFRSIFVPSLALGLTEAHDPEQRRLFADQFENGLKGRLANQPAPLHSFVEAMILAKPNCK